MLGKDLFLFCGNDNYFNDFVSIFSCYISSWFRLEFLNFLCLDGTRLGMCSKELNSIPQATTVTNHEKI